MVKIGISGAIRRENADGLDEPEVWKCVRSRERKNVYLFFYF